MQSAELQGQLVLSSGRIGAFQCLKIRLSFRDLKNPQNHLRENLQKGGIVKAPTLAVVGDNAGANSGNPEVISPLNKLQGMLDNSGGQDTVILTQILDLLKRIYEMFIIFCNNGGNTYSFTAELEGSTLFEEMIRQDELYRRRHNGKSAFA